MLSTKISLTRDCDTIIETKLEDGFEMSTSMVDRSRSMQPVSWALYVPTKESLEAEGDPYCANLPSLRVHPRYYESTLNPYWETPVLFALLFKSQIELTRQTMTREDLRMVKFGHIHRALHTFILELEKS